MKDNYKKLFQGLTEMNPSDHVYENIMARIQREKNQSLQIQFIVSGIFTLCSFVGIFFSFSLLIQGLYQSGIFQYLSLLFSDGGDIFAFWKEFFLLIVETLPFFEVALFLCAVLIFLGSSKIIMKNMKIALFHFNLLH